MKLGFLSPLLVGTLGDLVAFFGHHYFFSPLGCSMTPSLISSHLSLCHDYKFGGEGDIWLLVQINFSTE